MWSKYAQCREDNHKSVVDWCMKEEKCAAKVKVYQTCAMKQTKLMNLLEPEDMGTGRQSPSATARQNKQIEKNCAVEYQDALTCGAYAIVQRLKKDHEVLGKELNRSYGGRDGGR